MAVADVVLTGEGRFDRQTTLGKGPAALARTSRELGKPVVLFAGSVVHEEGLDTSLFRELIETGHARVRQGRGGRGPARGRRALGLHRPAAEASGQPRADDAQGRAARGLGLDVRAPGPAAHTSSGSVVLTTRMPAFWNSRKAASATRGKSSAGGSGSSGGAGTELIASSRMKTRLSFEGSFFSMW